MNNQASQLFLSLPEFRLSDMVDRAIEAMRQYEKPEGYMGAFSGGKDSVVIKQLAVEADINVEWHYHQTTIDPPELIRFMRWHHSEVVWDRPRQHLLRRAVAKGLPTRKVRWCCQEYKESTNKTGRTAIVGVRASESARRAANWQLMQFTRAHIKAARKHWVLAPIIDWRDEHVWSFIHDRRLPYCVLYDEGFKRLGCIGCPMAGAKRKMEFERWPGFERLWIRAARLCWEDQKLKMISQFPSWGAYWDYWLHEKSRPDENECQMDLAFSSGIE